MQSVLWLQAWFSLNKMEVHFLEACLEKILDTLALVYALQPPPEALPVFYPVLYPMMTEPADVKTYREIVTQLQEWKQTLADNQETVKQLAQAQEHLNEETFRDIFQTWASHQKVLVSICNKLLQTHILAQKIPSNKQLKMNMDEDVQCLAEDLLTARVETKARVFNSWLATAHWCAQTAPRRCTSRRVPW